MTWHLYIEPIVIIQEPEGPVREAKYTYNQLLDYGAQDICMVAADVDDTTDAALVLNVDVTKIPDNLNNNVGAGNLATVQTFLENRLIPGTWVTAATTYRTVTRAVYSMFVIVGRYQVVAQNYDKIMDGVTNNLNTTFGALPLAVRQALQSAAVQFGVDTSGFTGASTLRQILIGAGQQLIQIERQLGGITI